MYIIRIIEAYSSIQKWIQNLNWQVLKKKETWPINTRKKCPPAIIKTQTKTKTPNPSSTNTSGAVTVKSDPTKMLPGAACPEAVCVIELVSIWQRSSVSDIYTMAILSDFTVAVRQSHCIHPYPLTSVLICFPTLECKRMGLVLCTEGHTAACDLRIPDGRWS